MMETEKDEQEEVSSPTLQTLKTLERSWTGGSSESVQQWIDSLTEADYISALEERPLSPNQNNVPGPFADVRFLPLPGSLDEDELILGCEAKSLSRSNSSKGFSPRLSPLLLNDSDPVYPLCNGSYEVEVSEEDKNRHADEILFGSEDDCFHSLKNEDEEIKADHEPINQNRFPNLRSDSSTSLQSIPTLLAAMETNPEDLLRSLGFDQESFASPIYRIPVRFLTNASEAKGINTQQFYCNAADKEDQESLSLYEEENRRKLPSRFSQSSIDLSVVDTDDCCLARRRRSKMMQDIIPSITVEMDSCDASISEKNSPSRGSGSWRLSTVVEEIEPWSRKSSFSKPDKRSPLQRQKNMEMEINNGDNGEQEDSGRRPNGFSLDNTDITLRHTAARLEAIATSLEATSIRKAESDIFNPPDDQIDKGKELVEDFSGPDLKSGLSVAARNEDKVVSSDKKLFERRKETGSRSMSSPDCLKVTIPAVDVKCLDSFNAASSDEVFKEEVTNEQERIKTDNKIDRNFISNDIMSSKDSEATKCDIDETNQGYAISDIEHDQERDILNARQVNCKENQTICNELNTEADSQLESDGDAKKNEHNEDLPQKNDEEDNLCSRNIVVGAEGDFELEHISDNLEKEKLKFSVEVVRQFSEDSLDAVVTVDKNANDNDEEADNFVKRTTPLSCYKSEDFLNNFKIRSENGASRVVYRVVEKAENPVEEDLSGERKMPDEDEVNSHVEQIERKPRSWSARLLASLDLKNSSQSKNGTVSKTVGPLKSEETSQINIDNKQRTSSRIREYFRKLATGGIRSFGSLNDINMAATETNKHSQSLLDLSGGMSNGSNGHIKKEDKCDFNSGQKLKISDRKGETRLMSKSLQDVRRASLDFVPIRGSAFCGVEKLNKSPITVYQASIDAHNHREAGGMRDEKTNEGSLSVNRFCSITAENYHNLHRLGKEGKGSPLGPVYVDKDNNLCKNELSIQIKDELRSMEVQFGNKTRDFADDNSNPRNCRKRDCCGAFAEDKYSTETMDKISPSVITDRVKPRILTKGYSIESSGFEDETDACHSSPERVSLENGKRQFCTQCMQARIDKPILEKSLSSVSGVSRAVSRDSLERRSSRDGSEVNGDSPRDPITVDSNCGNDPRSSTPIEVDRTWADKSHFDFLVNQITALRKELSEQEERIEAYIDDRMQILKTSILTEISILNASQKISSADNSHACLESQNEEPE